MNKFEYVKYFVELDKFLLGIKIFSGDCSSGELGSVVSNAQQKIYLYPPKYIALGKIKLKIEPIMQMWISQLKTLMFL